MLMLLLVNQPNTDQLELRLLVPIFYLGFQSFLHYKSNEQLLSLRGGGCGWVGGVGGGVNQSLCQSQLQLTLK